MSAPAEKIAGSRNTVLVLDYDVLFRIPICEYLRHCGYRVLEAASTQEAKAIIEKRHIEIDIVLTDVELPGELNGFAFASWARSVRQSCIGRRRTIRRALRRQRQAP